MKQKGFTIIELIVSIGIMVFILAAILVNYNKFDSGVVMTNLAYDIALSIRTAQTYGVSTKSTFSGSTQNFETAYGINFDISSDPLSVKQYKLFSDVSPDGVYNSATSDVLSTTYKLNSSYYIKALCGLNNASTPVETCVLSGSSGKINITFKRPNPDAKLIFGASSDLSAVKIKIGSTRDSAAEKTIIVRPTGQISVQ